MFVLPRGDVVDRNLAHLEKKQSKMTPNSNNPIPKLRKAPQPQAHMKPLMETAKSDFHVYEVTEMLSL